MSPNGKLRSHGKKLLNTYTQMGILLREYAPDVFVRERAFSRWNADVQTLNKVVGIADMCLYRQRDKAFDEIPPLTVKKLVAGNGKATKEEIEAAVRLVVGDVEFETDDESDAVAVGIAWLAMHKYEVSGLPDYEAASK